MLFSNKFISMFHVFSSKNSEAVVRRCSDCNVIKKETPEQVFSCEFCEISKNTFLLQRLLLTAILYYFFIHLISLNCLPQKQPPGMFYKKRVLENFAKFIGKHLCQCLFKKMQGNFIKKETLAQVFSCKSCKISKNTFSYGTLRWLLL